MNQPVITVLMPVYNAERYIGSAISSVLTQTYRDFELLIINDGSTDSSLDIINNFDDSRIRVVSTENQGVAAALELGMDLALGDFIARMDADDVCMPDRLEKEVDCLLNSSNVDVVHGSVEYIDANSEPVSLVRDEGYSDIPTKWLLNWKNVPIHSTVMLRKAFFQENGLSYRKEMNRAEDFDLWNRVAHLGNFLYLPDVLIRYRIHSNNVSNSSPVDLQFSAQARVIQENFRNYGIDLDREMSEELAIISGATRINPIDRKYPGLNQKIHLIVDELCARFSQEHKTSINILRPLIARQYLGWSRYMLNTSRPYSAKLLMLGLRMDIRLAVSYRFWAVTAGVFVPWL